MKNGRTNKRVMIEQVFNGVAISKRMDKTVIVRVDRTILHPKYQKRSVKGKNYPVHDEKNEIKVGDVVSFVGCRPYSKTKKWRVVGVNQSSSN